MQPRSQGLSLPAPKSEGARRERDPGNEVEINAEVNVLDSGTYLQLPAISFNEKKMAYMLRDLILTQEKVWNYKKAELQRRF